MIGQTISHYKITSKLGQGGMGEVYQAEDTTLKREVAVKVLPEQFNGDPERLARFEREAQILASLNHPNIAAIHGLEQANGVRFLVLELVEGKTLAQLLTRGPQPLPEALEICRQIAEGLEAAHERGIIHRDLKPANIKITQDGKVKILDLGLATAVARKAAGTDVAEAQTITRGVTAPGMVLGTAAYMSPEQANGKPLDRRADIWAFGCVLYEVLTGKQAFAGATVSETMARVLRDTPDWSLLPQDSPAIIRSLLSRCLDKDPNLRLHDVADVRILVEEALSEPLTGWPMEVTAAAHSPLWRRAIPWGIAVIAVIAGVAFWGMLQPSPPTPRTTRTVVGLPPNQELASRPHAVPIAVSPDGLSLVYAAAQPGGRPQLYLRLLDQFEAKRIPASEDAESPFFSPDGLWVGFFAAGRLQKVSMAGGAPLPICRVSQGAGGASWGRDDTIIFGGGLGLGLFRVSASGGQPENLTTPASEKGEVHHGDAEILPDGTSVLFTVGAAKGSKVGVLSLETGDWRELLDGGAGARYLPTGHMIYSQSGNLRLVPFDLVERKLVDSATPILDGVSWSNLGGLEFVRFAVSATGTLVYVPGGNLIAPTMPVWVDREGRATSLPVDGGRHLHPRLSPDGKRIAVTKLHEDSGTGDIWIIDVESGRRTRLTVEGASYSPSWTPDGKHVTFVSKGNIFWKAADGSGEAEPLLVRENYQRPWSWSRDGKFLVFDDLTPAGLDLWVRDGKGDSRPFVATSFAETASMFSPDGRWLAYVSDESDRNEVYVEPYPGPGERSLVSKDGGRWPVWSGDGQELFYLNGDRMMAVAVETGPVFSAGTPRLLFEGQYFSQTLAANYDVSPDGQRFVMISEDELEAPTQINVVLNWFEELKQRVPSDP